MNAASNPTSLTTPTDDRRAITPSSSNGPSAPSPSQEALEPAAASRQAGALGARPGRRIGDRALYESEWLENADRMTNAAIAHATGGISPTSVAMDLFGWMAHLASSPGKQFELGQKAVRKALRLGRYAATCAADPGATPCIEPLAQDHRFEHEAWQRFPYNVIYQAFLLDQQWWHNATTGVRGVSKHNEEAVSFITRQVLDMFSPSNIPFLNPEIVQTTLAEGGANLLRGAQNFAEDLRRGIRGEPPAGTETFQVGKNLAVTPGKVVYRNRLMELIQYTPTTASVQREPVLMQSAWMMKYYILDLSPHNSLVKYLVDRGHTVFMISWLNPRPEDRDLGLEDYRKLGTMAAIDAISNILPDRKIHAVGYCLGGILLTIAAATMARDGDDRLASVTLFTTMTDFTEVGEINVFMDAGEVTMLEDIMWQKGYLDHKQISGGFQLLKSADLIWSKMVREYYLGNREPMFDLMAWNADGTRMPYRQHSEVLRRLYVDNELFEGKYMVGGRAISISNIHCPIFAVAAVADHVAPWHSVYKLHLQSDATELSFVLTSGGHNVGIVNEPGRPRRKFQMATCKEGERCLDAETWKAQTPVTQGSWWPAWDQWLTQHSSGGATPPIMGAPDKGYEPLCDAPGTYVHQK